MKLQVILSGRGMNAKGRRLVVDHLAELGARQTARGMATLSFEIPEERFATAFGTAAPDAARDGDVVGASGPPPGAALPVPEPLTDLVEDISVPPPARHFGKEP